jgi:hypothetical protein
MEVSSCVCLAQDNQLIRAGQWWRFITPVALHANLMHLLTNNYSLNRCCTAGLLGHLSADLCQQQ